MKLTGCEETKSERDLIIKKVQLKSCLENSELLFLLSKSKKHLVHMEYTRTFKKKTDHNN